MRGFRDGPQPETCTETTGEIAPVRRSRRYCRFELGRRRTANRPSDVSGRWSTLTVQAVDALLRRSSVTRELGRGHTRPLTMMDVPRLIAWLDTLSVVCSTRKYVERRPARICAVGPLSTRSAAAVCNVS